MKEVWKENEKEKKEKRDYEDWFYRTMLKYQQEQIDSYLESMQREKERKGDPDYQVFEE